MRDMATRIHLKQIYGPLSQKTLPNILKRELMEQFGFENMGLIADVLIARLLQLVHEYSPENKKLLPGQALWLAVAADEKAGPGKPMCLTRLVPVILTIVDPAELESMAMERRSHIELRPASVARLLKEAYAQGGVLCQSDAAVLLRTTTAQVCRAIKAWHEEHPDEMLPYRGTVHDLGRTTTHKLRAVELHLKGLLTREIARRMEHDPSSVDAYLSDFERVWQLHQDGKNLDQISFLTKIARSVVVQYIELIETYITEHGATHNDETPAAAKPLMRPAKRRKSQ